MPEVTVEANLYTPTRRFVGMRLAGFLARRSGSSPPKLFCNEVAEVAGEIGGKWTRPDIAALAISCGEFVPYWRADLHTFEVKTAGGLDVTGAHEARAQGRFGHFSWLVFQAVGRAEQHTNRYKEVVDSAAGLGVGVLVCAEPDDPDSWRIVEWPVRSETDNAVADAFVKQRFDAETRSDIRRYLSGLGWATTEDT